MIIQLDATIVRLAMGFASTEQTRYYLNGIHIEPHPIQGVFVVATDGHVMGVFHDETGSITGASSAIVHVSKAILKECKADRMGRRVLAICDVGAAGSNGRNSARFVVTSSNQAHPAPFLDMREQGAIIDGTFPDWRRILPAAPDLTAQPDAYNPNKLAPFAAVASVGMRGDFANAIRIYPPAAAGGPMAVTVGGNLHFYGILMGMRDAGGIDPAKPGWLIATAPREAAA